MHGKHRSSESSEASNSRSPPPSKKNEGSQDEEEDVMAAELFDPEGRKVLSRLQVRFADGELERLGIVNLSL